MIRIVLDANQFVSALLKPRSNPAQIISLIREDKVKLLMSEEIISEISNVLLYPKILKRHGKTPEYIAGFIRKLRVVSVMTNVGLTIDAIEDDPSDNKYLECAVEGGADFIISGDSHLKDLKVFRGIRIVSPADFIMIVKTQAKTSI